MHCEAVTETLSAIGHTNDLLDDLRTCGVIASLEEQLATQAQTISNLEARIAGLEGDR
jgi:hypothetical protein